MNTITNENGADLIRQYAKSSGNGFNMTKADMCKLMSESFNADIVDAFDIAHVTIARLVEECKEVLHMSDDKCDKTYTALTIIMSIGAIMQTQHTINEYDKMAREEANHMPETTRRKSVLLVATPHILQRNKELPQTINAMIRLFMINVVKDLG